MGPYLPRALIVAGSLLAVAVAGGVLVILSEVQTSRYRDLAEATRDGAITRGWIPDILPPSSSNIVEVHDIDTNEGYGSFEFSPADIAALKSSLGPAGAICRTAPRPTRIDSWPADLIGELVDERLKRSGLEVFQASRGHACIAIQTGTGTRGYFWQTAR